MGTKPTDLTLHPYSSHLNACQNTIPFTIKKKILIFLEILKYNFFYFLFSVAQAWALCTVYYLFYSFLMKISTRFQVFHPKSFLMTMQANLIGIPYFYSKSTIPNLLHMSTTQGSEKVDSSPEQTTIAIHKQGLTRTTRLLNHKLVT